MNRMSKFIAALALSSWTALAVADEPAGRVFATWNPQDASPGVTISPDHLTISSGTADWASIRTTIGVRAGSWYWETTYSYPDTANAVTGLATANAELNSQPGLLPYTPDGMLYSIGGPVRSGDCYVAGNVVASAGSVTSGTVVRHWLDFDAMSYRVARGGDMWITVLSGDDLYMGLASNTVFAVAGMAATNGAGQVTANFGATPFVYDVPGGANPGIYTDDALLQDGFDTLAE